jgi:hypothetical protein
MMGNLWEGAYDAAGGSSGISSMFSDRRLKMNITKVGVIKGITFYKWTWNAIANSLGHFGESFGVIADEVKDIIPNSVVRDKETGYDKVNYGKVIEELQ